MRLNVLVIIGMLSREITNTYPQSVSTEMDSTLKPHMTSSVTHTTTNSILQHTPNVVMVSDGVVTTTDNSTLWTSSAQLLYLTTSDITTCLYTNGTLRSTASEGLLTLDGMEIVWASLHTCLLHLYVAPNRILKFTDIQKQGCGIQLFIADTGADRALLYDSCPLMVSWPIFSFTNSASIRLQTDIRLINQFESIKLRFTAVSISDKPQLELSYTSSTAGFLQTPGWDSQADIPYFMDSWVKLQVPINRSVMVSFVDVSLHNCAENTFYDPLYLEKYQTNTASSNLLAKVCGAITPSVTIYTAPVLYFHFVSGKGFFYKEGFKLLFSFHNRYTLPQKLPSGRWNCSSVSDWSPYQQHFPCNLFPECLDKKDESVCPYTTDKCGPDFFTAEGSCFLLVKASAKGWDEANMMCASRELTTGRLTTLLKIDSVSKLLETKDRRTSIVTFFVGLRGRISLPYMYRNTYVWGDGTVVFVQAEKVFNQHEKSQCTSWDPIHHTISAHDCDRSFANTYVLCERDVTDDQDTYPSLQEPDMSDLASPQWTSLNMSLVQCPLHHVTHMFLACDPSSACWVKGYDSQTCAAPEQRPSPHYRCDSQLEHVPYTLVCDHRADCRDNSDEDFCHFDPCGSDRPFDCGNGQCISKTQKCNGQQDCTNGADEQCSWTARNETFRLPPLVSGLVILDPAGRLSVKPLLVNQPLTNNLCNDTDFRCPQSDVTYCLPVFLRCNGLYDCPGHGDEAACDSYTCPGFYRCRNSRVCVHPSHLCDGLYQCPQHDDELLCHLTCPDPCVCHGLAFFCSRPFLAHNFPTLRFLDASGTGMTPADVHNNRMLIHLALAACNLTQLAHVSLPNLRSLDLSRNLISTLVENHFKELTNLKEINLAGNPLSSFLPIKAVWSSAFSSLVRLDISNIIMHEVDISNIYRLFPNLQFLNMSNCDIDRIVGDGFKSLTNLRTLDVRGCSMTEFGPDILTELDSLESVDADNYKLCCPASLPPGFNPVNCRAPADQTSSCDALLRLDLYRIFLSVTAFLALMANTASLTYRLFFLKMNSKLGFDIFVTNLCLSDFLMGVYLAIIGITDRLYMGVYLWKDLEWKRSTLCQMAGFLAFLSTEVSAFIISLITLDRFLVLRYPFRRIHFSKRSALLASGVAWTVGAIIAAVPLLPAMSHWKFYGQSGICIPLPINPSNHRGHGYSFGVIIVLNFILFLVIALGQAFIFWSVRTNSMSACDTSKKNKNLTVARRLISVAACNFLCWFPIGVLGLMASGGVVVSEEVNVAMAIFVLPINSALNPFLYTVNLLLERRKRAQELRLMEKIKRDLQTSVTCARGRSSKSLHPL